MIALVAAAALAGSVSWPAKTVFIYGATNSCGAWLETQTSKASELGWIQGYWSGLNAAFGRTTGASTDKEGVFGEIEKVCHQNPSDTLLNAVNKAYSHMVAEGR